MFQCWQFAAGRCGSFYLCNQIALTANYNARVFGKFKQTITASVF
ncbi:hypothetical protein SRB521_00787 [Intestinimonas butyriciproducens]|nr:hypothetical protein SRB521_00787 [Intestinimonas butyriciproducens]